MDGKEIWTRQVGTPESTYARSIAIDNSGIYVAGFTHGTLPDQISSGEADGFVRKYDVDGSEIWTKQFGSSSGENVWGIAVDNSGVFVAGKTGSPIDAFIAKLTKDSVYLSFLYLPVVNR
ncbi:MAG: hypothetical protein DWI57_10525 [Chloroflexi bacterium]|nr:MAG: hypothetical protein DWI57_10525 [Chloroflexota bacterium]